MLKREWIGTQPMNFPGKRKKKCITLSDVETKILESIGDGSLTKGIRRMAYAGRMIAELDPYSFERALRILKRHIDDHVATRELEDELLFGEKIENEPEEFETLKKFMKNNFTPKQEKAPKEESSVEVYKRLTVGSTKVSK
jgi:hypothetical protein